MSSEPAKILIADDDPAMLRLMGKWLEGEGYQVLRAGDGRMAMELIEAERPRLLVTDWEMPNVNGLELCRWIREQDFGHYLYTIFLTMRTESSELVKCLEAGADDFLKKPLDRNELLARIRSGSRVMELEQRLSRLAKTDVITGLSTRRVLLDDLNREWSRSQRYNTTLSCVMIDIDYFKRVNDTHGHQAGDEILRRLGQLLHEEVRGSEFLGRFGGEEFLIVLPETTETEAVQRAERIRSRISEISVNINGSDIQVSASFGVAQRLADTAIPETLVDMADQALVVAKRSGRDRVIAYCSLAHSPVVTGGNEDLAALLEDIPARDVMTAIIAPLDQTDSAATASNYFLRFRIPSAPVVDENGQLVGILSEKDLMAIMLGPDWWTVPIKDIMRKNVVCYDENTSALTIYEFLARVVIRGVVIVKQGRPTGLITRGCVLRFFMNLLAAKCTSGVFPEVDTAASELVERMGHASVHDRISKTVRSLAAEARDMESRLSDSEDDLVPCVVGGASRVQELVIDLLAISRYAQSWDSSQIESRESAEVSGAMRFALATAGPGRTAGDDGLVP
jgi:diguanylate cyclase (GGDEF)-like protein